MTYKITRDSKIILETEIYGTRTKQAPTADFIDVDFIYFESIVFQKNDVLNFEGQDFFLDDTNITIQKEGLNTYHYRLKFVAKNYRLSEIALLGYDSENKLTLPSFNINANLRTLLDLALANASRVKSEQFDEIRKVGFVEGYQLDMGNGGIEDNETFNTTNFIPVLKGEKIAISDVSWICIYDTNKNFINTIDVDGDKFMTMNQEGFIRVDWNNTESHPLIQKAFISLNIPDTPLEYFEIDNEYISSFLGKLSGTFNLPFTIDDNVITFGENGVNTNQILTQGVELTDITNKNNDNHKLINVVYATGSTENLPSDYGSERLTIPPLKNDSSIKKWGVCEGFFRDENLKPTTSGVFTYHYENLDIKPSIDIITGNKKPAMCFYMTDINYDTKDNNPIINITSGKCNGVSFIFTFRDSIGYIGVIIPYDKYYDMGTPEKGDTFFISNIKQPPQVVTQAENILKEKATNFLNENSTPYQEVDVNVNPLVNIQYGLNYLVKIVDKQLNINDIYNIVGYTETLDKIKRVTLELSQKPAILRRMKLITPNLKLNEIVATQEGLQQQINELNKP